jgi:FkbM family methyltransferase
MLASRTFAIEADPIAYDELRANLLLNPTVQEKTWIHLGCVSNKRGVFPMSGGGGDSMAVVNVVSDSAITGSKERHQWLTDCETFEDMILRFRIVEPPALIKVDIEGAESIMAEGLLRYLSGLSKSKLPTLYLSLHTWLWVDLLPADEVAAANERIKSILRLYEHVFLDGELTSPVDLSNFTICEICTYLATNVLL